MKKIFTTILSLLLCASCATSSSVSSEENVESTPQSSLETEGKDTSTLKILSASGAPSAALLPLLGENNNNVEAVAGSDVISSALMACDVSNQYDIIIAPINLGVKANCGDESTYQLAGVLTWGNLYIVGSQNHDDTLLAFGQNAVPGSVLNAYDSDLYNNATWVSSAADVQTAILAGESNYALLAQPAVSATIAKAKQQDIELSILADLQEVSDDYGYAQAAVFVSSNIDKEVFAKWFEDTQEFLTMANEDSSVLQDYEDVLETAGLPSNVTILENAFTQMNVNLKDINDTETYEKVKNDLTQFYSLSIDNATIYTK